MRLCNWYRVEALLIGGREKGALSEQLVLSGMPVARKTASVVEVATWCCVYAVPPTALF